MSNAARKEECAVGAPPQGEQTENEGEFGRTREGLSRHELNMLGKMQDAISDEASRERPSLAEMAAWVDDIETRERNGLHAAACVNGYVPTPLVRPCAIARALHGFLEWAVKYREDVELLYRAKLHMERRRG